MRFVFISTMEGSPWGGSEELWSQTALRLRAAGHEVTASVKGWPKLDAKVLALSANGIRVHTRAMSNTSLATRVLRRITDRSPFDFAELLEPRPDLVVISQGYNIEGLECMTHCRRDALPFASIVQCNSETWWPQDERDRGLVEDYRCAKRIYCVSSRNLELLERQVGEPLPHGVVVRNPFNVSPDASTAWPKESGTLRLACVARLDPSSKGHDLLFQVLARPQWRERPVEVNLFGSGVCEASLRRLADHLKLKMVHFRGFEDHVASIWTDNHLLVLPSRFEGLPLALVEAMWCGRPAVVTDVAGNTELCVDGETGFVASAPVTAQLEDAMERAWDRRQDWRAMGLAARARVERMISKDPVADFCRQLLDCASAHAAS